MAKMNKGCEISQAAKFMQKLSALQNFVGVEKFCNPCELAYFSGAEPLDLRTSLLQEIKHKPANEI